MQSCGGLALRRRNSASDRYTSRVNPLRIGMVGLGHWARDVHIPNLLRVPDADVVAICGRSEQSRAGGRRALAAAANSVGSPPREYADYRKLLDDRDIDAVVISTPNR